MSNPFSHLPIYVLSFIIFCLILISNWLGYQYKKRQLELYPGQVQEAMGSVEGSMLGVLSLLLGFTFSVAVSKYEARRHFTVDEANLIGTAILRCDMYPDSIRSPLLADFKQYIEARIDYYDAGNNEEKLKEQLEKGEAISHRIWKR